MRTKTVGRVILAFNLAFFVLNLTFAYTRGEWWSFIAAGVLGVTSCLAAWSLGVRSMM